MNREEFEALTPQAKKGFLTAATPEDLRRIYATQMSSVVSSENSNSNMLRTSDASHPIITNPLTLELIGWGIAFIFALLSLGLILFLTYFDSDNPALNTPNHGIFLFIFFILVCFICAIIFLISLRQYNAREPARVNARDNLQSAISKYITLYGNTPGALDFINNIDEEASLMQTLYGKEANKAGTYTGVGAAGLTGLGILPSIGLGLGATLFSKSQAWAKLEKHRKGKSPDQIKMEGQIVHLTLELRALK